jgi:hypothetical protein
MLETVLQVPGISNGSIQDLVYLQREAAVHKPIKQASIETLQAHLWCLFAIFKVRARIFHEDPDKSNICLKIRYAASALGSFQILLFYDTTAFAAISFFSSTFPFVAGLSP